MSELFHLILRAVPADRQPAVAALIGRAFSLKEATCVSISASAPITILTDLTTDEAVAVCFALAPIERAGAVFEAVTTLPVELSKIDWPRRPQIFKRDISEVVADLTMVVELEGALAPLSALIGPKLPALGQRLPRATSTSRVDNPALSLQHFRGIQLPEITPFSNPVLPGDSGGGDEDALKRLNELFPEEQGFATSQQDISSLLDQILPDDAGAANPAPAPAASVTPSAGVQQRTPSQGQRITTNSATGSNFPPVAGWSLFLPKFADEARRQKAVPLIAEHGKMQIDDADQLSRKMIIPVIKGGSQADAEAAQKAFAKIGVVAKVKAPGT